GNGITDGITGPRTYRKLIGNGHDGLIFKEGAQRFTKGPCPIGLPWVDQIEPSTVRKQFFGHLLIKLEIQRNAKPTVPRLDALIDGPCLRASFGAHIVEYIGSIEV